MERIEKSIEVTCPVRTVYNQWTQFEEFPKFMEGVTEVRQLQDDRLFWRAEAAGVNKEWYAPSLRWKQASQPSPSAPPNLPLSVWASALPSASVPLPPPRRHSSPLA